MQYHPSRAWLLEHGHDPRLTRKVHVTCAAQLLNRHEMLKHPAVILHELAHGYHDQFSGFGEPRILAAFEKAKASGAYEEVLLASLRIAQDLDDGLHTVAIELLAEQPGPRPVVDRIRGRKGFDPKRFDGTNLWVGSIMLIGDVAESP